MAVPKTLSVSNMLFPPLNLLLCASAESRACTLARQTLFRHSLAIWGFIEVEDYVGCWYRLVRIPVVILPRIARMCRLRNGFYVHPKDLVHRRLSHIFFKFLLQDPDFRYVFFSWFKNNTLKICRPNFVPNLVWDRYITFWDCFFDKISLKKEVRNIFF